MPRGGKRAGSLPASCRRDTSTITSRSSVPEMNSLWKHAVIIVAVTCSTRGASGTTIGLSRTRIVDLTHAFNAQTLYWPTSPSAFQLQQLAFGPTPGGFFYSAYAFSTPEHGGTHLDAPIHFSSTGNT